MTSNSNAGVLETLSWKPLLVREELLILEKLANKKLTKFNFLAGLPAPNQREVIINGFESANSKRGTVE